MHTSRSDITSFILPCRLQIEHAVKKTLLGLLSTHLHTCLCWKGQLVMLIGCGFSVTGCLYGREGRAWVSPSGVSSTCEGYAPLLERMQRTCIAHVAAASEVSPAG